MLMVVQADLTKEESFTNRFVQAVTMVLREHFLQHPAVTRQIIKALGAAMQRLSLILDKTCFISCETLLLLFSLQLRFIFTFVDLLQMLR